MVTWPTMPLGDLCDLINGRAFKPSDWGTSGLPIIRIQNLNNHEKPFNMFGGDYAEKHFIDDGETLLSWSGTPGTSFGCFRWLRGPALLNQRIFKVIVNENVIDSAFFICAVNSKLDEMIRQAHGGVGLRHITKKKLEAILLPVPALPEQRRIVSRIKECMKRVEKIESLTGEQAIIEKQVVRATRREFLGGPLEIPAGWKEKSLDELANVIYGVSAAISKNKDPKIGPPIVRMANMSIDGHLDLSDLRYCPIPKGKEDHFSLKPGDLLLNWRSGSAKHVGKTALFNEIGLWTCASFILRIRSFEGISNNRFLRHVLNFMRSEGVFSGKSRMQINHKLNAKEFSAFPIRVPPSLEEQEIIADQLDAIEAFSYQIRNEISYKLEEVYELRDSILRKAFSGEL